MHILPILPCPALPWLGTVWAITESAQPFVCQKCYFSKIITMNVVNIAAWMVPSSMFGHCNWPKQMSNCWGNSQTWDQSGRDKMQFKIKQQRANYCEFKYSNWYHTLSHKELDFARQIVKKVPRKLSTHKLVGKGFIRGLVFCLRSASVQSRSIFVVCVSVCWYVQGNCKWGWRAAIICTRIISID